MTKNKEEEIAWIIKKHIESGHIISNHFFKAEGRYYVVQVLEVAKSVAKQNDKE